MTILLVSESFYPLVSGVSVTVQRLAAALAAEGHKVAVAAPSQNGRYATYEKDGYTVHSFPSIGNPLRKGHRFIVFPERRLRKLFATVKPDVVHVHNPGLLGGGAIVRAAALNLPRLITHHFTDEYLSFYLPGPALFRQLIQALLRKRFRRLYSLCTLITVPTRTVAEDIASWNLPVPVRVISNGVECRRFSEAHPLEPGKDPWPDQPGAAKVLYVGRIDPEKNLGVVLRALQWLSSHQAVLLVVGGGSSLPELQSLASELGIQGKITWQGVVRSDDPLLARFYRSADLFCMPSFNETESMVTLEAMAAGLPILAAKRGALPELVENGANGFLLPADRPEEWAEKIASLSSDASGRQKMGAASQKKALERDFDRVLKKWEETYRSLAKEV